MYDPIFPYKIKIGNWEGELRADGTYSGDSQEKLQKALESLNKGQYCPMNGLSHIIGWLILRNLKQW